MNEIRRANIETRNKAIEREFNRLFKEERYQYDECLSRISSRFYLADRTVANIVKGLTGRKRKKQESPS